MRTDPFQLGCRDHALRSERRAVSTPVSYVLTLGIMTLLITGVIIAAGGVLDGQNRATVQDELEVVGQQLAGDISAADRLVRAGGASSTVHVSHDFPDRVTGQDYTVEIVAGKPVAITLSTDEPEVVVTVKVWVEKPVFGTTFNGGPVTIDYKNVGGTWKLVVNDA